MVYDLDNWPKTPLNNITLKNGLFSVTNIAKNMKVIKVSMSIVAME